MNTNPFTYECPKCIICGIQESITLTPDEREALLNLMAGKSVDESLPRLHMIRTGIHKECQNLNLDELTLW